MNKSSGAAIGGGIAAVVIAVAIAVFMFSDMSNEQESIDNSLGEDKN